MKNIIGTSLLKPLIMKLLSQWCFLVLSHRDLDPHRRLHHPRYLHRSPHHLQIRFLPLLHQLHP